VALALPESLPLVRCSCLRVCMCSDGARSHS
jgi:hypothetical protein